MTAFHVHWLMLIVGRLLGVLLMVGMRLISLSIELLLTVSERSIMPRIPLVLLVLRESEVSLLWVLLFKSAIER